MIRLAIAGAAGRMGCALIRQARAADGVCVAAAVEHQASSALGKDAGVIAGGEPLGVAVRERLDVADFDVLLEFTTPAATVQHARICRLGRRKMLIGTTGLVSDDKNYLREAAADIAILVAANTSVGINLCAALVKTAAQVLGSVSDIEIVEAHHRHKVDAPSGTAWLLAEAAAATLGTDLARDGVFTRHGHTGARPAGAIGFSAIRGGDIAGEHTVMFIGDGERLEITHKATDRKIFAAGAIQAAQWLDAQAPGMYTMQDSLNLNTD